MKIFSWPVYIVVLAMPGLLAAQQGTVSGPVAGFVFDGADQTLRPVRGVPGASLIGDPVSFGGMTVASVYVAPRQDSALVVDADQSLHLFLLNGGSPTEVTLGGLSGVPDRVVFSPSGTAMALVSPGSTRVVTGLPNAPTLAGSIKVESFAVQVQSGLAHATMFGPPMTLSDDGTYLLAIIEGSARLLSIQGQDRHLMAAQAGAQVSFAAGNHDAAVMDSVTGLTFIHDVAGAAGTQLLAVPDEGLAGPTGLAFSRDEKTIYVASGTAQSVVAFNIAEASRASVGCSCTPTTLVPMGNLFRLTEFTAAPLWLFDGSTATPRTVFVPARSE